MPWCRQCDVEYVEGKTICVDCGSTLVDSSEEPKEPFKFLETDKELFAKKFVDFLKYSKISNASYEYNETDKNWVVLIDEATKKQVIKLYNAFYSVETTSITEEALNSGIENVDTALASSVSNEEDSDSNDLANDADSKTSTENEDKYATMFDKEELKDIIDSRKPKDYIPPAFVKKEDQFKDLKSTASTFIFVSLLGICILILNAIGIISLFDGIFSYVVMSGLFLAFLYIGITTHAKSKRVEKEISSENNLTESIEKWLHQNITKANFDDIDAVEPNPEIGFFKKLDYMKELIIDEFGELDDGYLDHLVEEYYNNNFDSQNE